MDINILDLHFDILILICKHIEAFEDKKNFARSHPKLWDAVAYQCRKHFQSVINFNNNKIHYVYFNWDFILKLYGSNITKIYNQHNYVDSGDLMEIAAKFCPNLKSIHFLINIINMKKVKENLQKLGQLKDIRMRYDFLRLEINRNVLVNHMANLIESLQSLTNLRHLDFGSHLLQKMERKCP